MTTLTIDILDEKALNLIKDLETLKIIRVRKDKHVVAKDMISKYKGAMSPQPQNEIDKQINDLRNEWD